MNHCLNVNFAIHNAHNWSWSLNKLSLRREEKLRRTRRPRRVARPRARRGTKRRGGRHGERERERERESRGERDTLAMKSKSSSSCRALYNIRERTVAVAVHLENYLHEHANGRRKRCASSASSAARLCIRPRVQQRLRNNYKHNSENCLVTFSESFKLYFSICTSTILFIEHYFYDRLCNFVFGVY